MLGRDREYKYSIEKVVIGRGKVTDLGHWKINVLHVNFLGVVPYFHHVIGKKWMVYHYN